MRKNVCVLVLPVLIICLLCACDGDVVQSSLWQNAVYTSDVVLGDGGKTIEIRVVAEDKSVTLTLNTGKDNLEDALVEHGLISGEKGPYGMYVKFVNGMEADYNKTKSYWSLTKNGEYMTTGVGNTLIKDGEHYEFAYVKQ